MAGAQPRRGGVSLPGKRSKSGSSIVSKISNSSVVSMGKQATSEASFISKKLLKSTGKAAWIAGTSFLVLVVPLIIAMDREQQLNEMEQQQQTLLGSPPS